MFRSLAQGYHCRVSPLQLAKAYSAIANNGLVINPRLIKKNKIDIFEDKKYEKEFNKVKNVIKKVIDEGSAQRAAIHGYTAGGKTGTAELYI
jgi:cell division protein FtsI/penicillin-binding protein 2